MSREKQIKLTVTISDHNRGIVPQVILVPGETKMVDLDQAVVKAVREQTISDGSNIINITYKPGEQS